MAHRFRNVTRLFRIEVARLSFSDGAKAAMTGADVAAEHERRRPVIPAFEDIRAPRFLTDCVQVEPLDQLEHLILVSRIAETDAQPFGFWLTNLLIIANYA
jgi:hypothetical protein